jgi:hypothetical protein
MRRVRTVMALLTSIIKCEGAERQGLASKGEGRSETSWPLLKSPVSPAQTILPSFNSGLPLAYQDTILLHLGVQVVPRMPVVADEQHRVSRTEDDSTILVGTRSSS